jgi:hypothetical protein
MQYSVVTNGVPSIPGSLPLSITIEGGFTRTSLEQLSTQELIALGVYPVTDSIPSYNTETEELVLESLIVRTSDVLATYGKQLKPQSDFVILLLTTGIPYQAEDNVGGLIEITNISPNSSTVSRLVIEATAKTPLPELQTILWNEEPTASTIIDNARFLLDSADAKNIAYIFTSTWTKVSGKQLAITEFSIPINNGVWLSIATLKAWRAASTDTIKIILNTK